MKLVRTDLDNIGHPLGCLGFQTYMKNAIRTCNAFQPNTVSSLINRVNATEEDFRSSGTYDATTDGDAKKLERFMDSVVTEVMVLEPDGRPRGRINYVSQDALDTAIGEMKEDLLTINDNQLALAAREGKQDWSHLPESLRKLIIDCVSTQVGTLSCKPVTKKDITVAEDKPYDWFCHTHGVNTSHGTKIDGTPCAPCKNPGPDHDETATYRDPKGGNTKRNDKVGKVWRNGKVFDA